MLLGDTVKTATASRSREIFLGLGNTGLSLPQLLRSSRLFEADPSPALRATAVWTKRIESIFSRCAATPPPEGKATHCILSRLRLLTNAVRCAPLTRSPLPCKQGRANFCGEAAGPQCFTQISILSQSCRLLEKGRGKAAGWIDGICMNPLLRRSCLYEADPSPALWAAPFSKGARF